MTRGWPVTLTAGSVTLRPLHRRDRQEWFAVRRRNAAWLRPWEATPPDPRQPAPSFPAMVAALRRDARAGRALPFVITIGGRLVGQVTLGGIVHGSQFGGHIGYWIDQSYAGQGNVPTSVALVADHAFGVLGLHRLEIAMRPENAPSRRVAEKLGFRPEGLRERYLHIDGDWRDHLIFALCAGDIPEGVLARFETSNRRV
jgi:[ribosomal protein S5]-alanine N-acetyltransferase